MPALVEIEIGLLLIHSNANWYVRTRSIRLFDGRAFGFGSRRRKLCAHSAQWPSDLLRSRNVYSYILSSFASSWNDSSMALVGLIEWTAHYHKILFSNSICVHWLDDKQLFKEKYHAITTTKTLNCVPRKSVIILPYYLSERKNNKFGKNGECAGKCSSHWGWACVCSYVPCVMTTKQSFSLCAYNSHDHHQRVYYVLWALACLVMLFSRCLWRPHSLFL